MNSVLLRLLKAIDVRFRSRRAARPGGRRLLVVTHAGGFDSRSTTLVYREMWERDGYAVHFVASKSLALAWLTHTPHLMRYRGFRRLVLPGLRRLEPLLQYLKDLFLTAIVDAYDVVLVYSGVPPGLLRRFQRRRNFKVIFCFDDAVWLPLFQKSVPTARFDAMLATADSVVTDNEFLARYARQYNEHVFAFLGSPQFDDFLRPHQARPKQDDGSLVIGWIGSPLTLFSLYAIWNPLERLFREFPNLLLRLVGTGYDRACMPPFEAVRVECIPTYGPQQRVEWLRSMDIGVYPLFENANSFGRGPGKSMNYMCAGVPVVASNYGCVPELIQDGVNGLVASNDEEWYQQLKRLITDPDLRRRIGAAGYETIAQYYTTPVRYQYLKQAFDCVEQARADNLPAAE